MLQVNILDINTHDETHFLGAVSNAIIRAWAQGETTERLVTVDYTVNDAKKENSSSSGNCYKNQNNSIQ